MNPVQIAVVVRALVMIFGPWLSAHGYLTVEQMDHIGDPQVIGEILGWGSAAAALLWSLWSHRPTGLVNAAAAWLKKRGGAVIAPARMADSDATHSNVVSSATAAGRLPGVAA